MPDLIDRWCEIRELGNHTLDTAAVRLGVRRDTLRRSLERAHQAGDPRVPTLPKQAVQAGYRDLDTSQMTTTNVRVEDHQREAATRFVKRHAQDADDERELLDYLFGQRKTRRPANPHKKRKAKTA